MNKDYMVRATAADGQIRAFAINGKEMAEKARSAHGTSPVMTAALGRLLCGAAMMGVMMKGEKDLLTIQVQRSGKGACGNRRFQRARQGLSDGCGRGASS